MREAASKQVITVPSGGSHNGQMKTEESCLHHIQKVLEDFLAEEASELSFKRGGGGDEERV